MILRRITESVKAQNWFAVGIDLVIVVLGVFIGLQVQQWADARREGRLERAYTERLQVEVLNLIATRAPLVEERNRFNDALATATRLLHDMDMQELGDFECQSIAYSYVISNPTDDLAALIELQSTGQLSIFSNPQVSEALGAFMLVRARAMDSLAGIMNSQLNLQVRHPELIQLETPSSTATGSYEPAIFHCDLAHMRASLQFRNDFELNRTNYRLHVRDNARVDTSLIELNQVLVGVLGLAREAGEP